MADRPRNGHPHGDPDHPARRALYTSNFLKSATACKDGASYGQYSAVCLETQDFPDAPNHPDFPDTTVLPDRPYSATTLYRFDLAPL